MPRGEALVPRTSQSRAGRPRSGEALESGVPPSNGAKRRSPPPRTKPSASSPAARLRAALATAACLALAVTLSGCSTFGVAPFPEPIRPPIEAEAEDTPAPQAQAQEASRYSPTPGVHITRTQARGVADDLGADLEGPPIKAAFNGVPIVPFINEVFGTELGMSFVISPGLQEKRDLVTLRLTSPVPPRQFFSTARQVLQEYGVTIREQDGVLTFLATQEIESGEVPLLISGRTLPEVPATHRTIFQLVPLHVVAPSQVIGMLRDAFPRTNLEVSNEPERNAVLLKGTLDWIAQALELIEVLDQPLLRGRHGLIVEPRFMAPEDLSDAVSRVLEAEGYNVGSSIGNIIFLPFDDIGKLVIFAQTPALLDHAVDWIESLDEDHQGEVESGLFTYEVRNTQVADLVEVLAQIVGDDRAASGRSQRRAEGDGATGGIGGSERLSRPGSNSLVVDERRNLLIFRGSGEEWAEIREVLEKLDQPVPSVLIEMLIAEVTLTHQEGSGFDFLLREGISGDWSLTGGTRDALGIQTKGLSLVLDNAGTTRAVLDLFYEDGNVSIRSQPKLLVKSGEQASINVGNEIPVISQTSQDSIQLDGSTNVLQQVTYRSTGINLSITPLVQAGGLVDLEISQTLSEARPTAATSIAGSPTILTRSLSTGLTLKDGSSLLMGGLISENVSSGAVGVPGFSRIPLFGRLFRVDSYQGDRTELLVMVTPYVIRNHLEGARLTEEIKDQLELHQRFVRE